MLVVIIIGYAPAYTVAEMGAVLALYIPKSSHRKSAWSDAWILLLMFKNSECCSLVGGTDHMRRYKGIHLSVFVVQGKGFSDISNMVLRHAQSQDNSEGDIACIKGAPTLVY